MLHKAKIWISVSQNDLTEEMREANKLLDEMSISWLIIPVTNFPIFPVGTEVDVVDDFDKLNMEIKIVRYTSHNKDGHSIECVPWDMFEEQIISNIELFDQTKDDTLIYSKPIDFLG